MSDTEVSTRSIKLSLTKSEIFGLVFRLAILGVSTYYGVRWIVKAMDPTRKQKQEAKEQVHCYWHWVVVMIITLPWLRTTIPAISRWAPVPPFNVGSDCTVFFVTVNIEKGDWGENVYFLWEVDREWFHVTLGKGGPSTFCSRNYKASLQFVELGF